MNRTFSTPEPIVLHTELGAGQVTVHATDTTETTTEVTGKLAEETRVEQDGRTISVIAPKQRGTSIFGSNGLRVTATVPTGSDLSTVLGSADLAVTGRVGDCSLRSGSGDVTLERAQLVEVTAGSGDVRIEHIEHDLSSKSGSGDLVVGVLGGDSQVVSGSGDLTVSRSVGRLSAKTGSGTIRIEESGEEVSATGASGDLHIRLARRGAIQARTASGDVTVGVLAGVPVWTDLNTVSGTVRSELESLGEPAEDQDYVELRTRTVSGDVHVRHVPAPQDRQAAHQPG